MMRRKHLLIILLIISASISSEARLPDGRFFRRVNMGLEWSYTQSLLRTWNYNLLSEEGYRIFDKDAAFMFHPNANVSAQIGFLLNDHFVIALHGGYAGIGKDNRLIPVQLRLTWFPEPVDEDGGFFYLQGGPAFHLRPQEMRQAWLFVSGMGYRLRLNAECNLDFSLGLKYLYDHPLLPDPEGPGYVPAQNIRKNNAGSFALDLSMGFNC